MAIPFTTASSDFLKVLPFKEERKADLIDYAATDFAALRIALINYLKAVYPLEYNNFNESDLGIVFTELVSYVGAIQSMKADMIANESFLATAKDRNNVRKLLELIGIKMKGPISSAANARVTFSVAASADESYSIEAEDRVSTISSPEDGGPLNYTLYTFANGIIDDPNTNSTVILNSEHSIASSGLVWENVALLEGAFARDTGTFNEVDALKKVTLAEGPVIENSVQVFVDTTQTDASGVYKQVTNIFFASSLDDKVFEISYDEEYNGIVLFGDGKNGVSPPSNSTYIITYRVGGGSRGNLQNSILNALIPGTLSTDSIKRTGNVENISIATGGADAETVAHAKRYGPQFFKTQDRLVSLSDYVAFVANFIGPIGALGIATAVVRKAFCSANIVDIYVLERATDIQLQKASLTYKSSLLTAMKAKKMLTDEIVIVDGLIRSLDLVVTINLAETMRNKEGEIKGKVSFAILNYFSIDNRHFGETLILSDLNRIIFTVPEVLFSSIDNLTDNIILQFNEVVQLNNLVINVSFS